MENDVRPIAEGAEYRRIINRYIDCLHRQAVCYKEAAKSLDSLIAGAERDKNYELKAYYTEQYLENMRSFDFVNKQIEKLKNNKNYRDGYVYWLIDAVQSMDKKIFLYERLHLKRDRKALAAAMEAKIPLTDHELGIVAEYQGAILDTTIARAAAKIMCGHTGYSGQDGDRIWYNGGLKYPINYIPTDAVFCVRGLERGTPQEFCESIKKVLRPENLQWYQDKALEAMKSVRIKEAKSIRRRSQMDDIAEIINPIKKLVDISVAGAATLHFINVAVMAILPSNDEEWLHAAGWVIETVKASAWYAAASAGVQCVINRMIDDTLPSPKVNYSKVERLLADMLNEKEPKSYNEGGE